MPAILIGQTIDWSLPRDINLFQGEKYVVAKWGCADGRLVFGAGVSVGLVAEEGLDEGGSEGHGWEVLVDAGGLEEDFGGMQLNAAGTRVGFTLLELTACMPGTICSTWNKTHCCATPSTPHSDCYCAFIGALHFVGTQYRHLRC